MNNHSILLRASTTCYGLLWYERPDAHLFRTGPVWGDCDQPSNHAHAIMPGKRTSKIPNYSSCDFRKFVCINCLYIYIYIVYVYIYICICIYIYSIYVYIYVYVYIVYMYIYTFIYICGFIMLYLQTAILRFKKGLSRTPRLSFAGLQLSTFVLLTHTQTACKW